ncbi:MAG: hypothetical protein AMXMBFR58_25670 [Phycisphaerae bacterium]
MQWWLWIAGWLAAMSLVTLAVFAWDKRCAVMGRRRVPELTLHLFELLGGWPGAWFAFGLVRHKNRKLSYVAVTVVISALHMALLIASARAD